MPAKNVTIDVNVNVEKLYNGGTIDECCTLSDDNGGNTPTGNPEQFSSKVMITLSRQPQSVPCPRLIVLKKTINASIMLQGRSDLLMLIRGGITFLIVFKLIHFLYYVG